MNPEQQYFLQSSHEHIRAFGQYFTKDRAARFMCAFALMDAGTMLDPAAGNSIFLKYARELAPACTLTGYELDKEILEFFGNPSGAEMRCEDYLKNGWYETYDAIVGNPPYNRFQAVPDREEILRVIEEHTGEKYSSYTNLYVLFLLKSIHQMSEHGRLAYIIPSEFLNSEYGTQVKQLLIDRRLLRAIVNFENDSELFENATTTCCILLLDREPKTEALFVNVQSLGSLDIRILEDPSSAIRVSYDKLKASAKWRSFLRSEDTSSYRNLVPVTTFCRIKRGIATGANEYFCFTKKRAEECKIPDSLLTKCVCRSVDLKTAFYTEEDHVRLSAAGKPVYLLDVTEKDRSVLEDYIAQGEADGIPQKYLPSKRKPWFKMEKQTAAPIWVSTACRENIKFIRNLAGHKSLTAFHSVYVRDEFAEDTDVLFCYFLTKTAQAILFENRKELGNGLNKFQPKDLLTAEMLDLRLLTPEDRAAVLTVYEELKAGSYEEGICRLDQIFGKYLN